MSSFAEEVTYQRAALLLGLATPESVHAWAEGALHAEAALDAEPETVVDRLLRRVALDVADGRRTIDDTIHVFAQMRRMIALPPDVARMLDAHEDAYRLAVAGVEGSVDAVRVRVADWLGARMPSPDDALARVTFATRAEGAAFVAALSRFLASPAGAAHAGGASPVVAVVAVAGTEALDVYLDTAALAATRDGFGEPPVLDVLDRAALPRNAVPLLDMDRGAHGRDDIAARLAALL